MPSLLSVSELAARPGYRDNALEERGLMAADVRRMVASRQDDERVS